VVNVNAKLYEVAMRTKLTQLVLAAIFLALAVQGARAALVNGIQAVVDEAIITRHYMEYGHI